MTGRQAIWFLSLYAIGTALIAALTWVIFEKVLA